MCFWQEMTFIYFQNISQRTSFQKFAKGTSHCIVVSKPWAGGSLARIYRCLQIFLCIAPSVFDTSDTGCFGNFVFGFGIDIEGRLERSLWTSGNETTNYEWVLGQDPNMGLVSFQGFGCFSFL